MGTPRRARHEESASMGRPALLTMMVALLLALTAGEAVAKTINGTAKGETLRGTNSADTINGRGGNDDIRARGGSDKGPGLRHGRLR